jgi:hypothetical protein
MNRLTSSTAGRLAVAALVATLPFSGSACGRTACFQFTQDLYDQHGACPAQENALANFSDPSCPGPVVSVDSEGTFDGELCCYSVTQQAIDPVIGGGCFNGGGFGGGFGGVSVGFGGAGGVNTTAISVTTGVGGQGGSPGCSTCAAEAATPSMDQSLLCPDAATFWDALTSCACGTGACSAACFDTFCVGLSSSGTSPCMTCLADPSSFGCGIALNNCLGN